MRTRSFQLEETVLGTFLLQGLLGGVLAGFVYTVAACLYDEHIKFSETLLFITAFLIVFASVVGVFKASIMWGVYRLTRIQVGSVARVVITSIATGLFALALGLVFDYRQRSDLAVWVLILMSGGLPTAILVGSNVKPWDLFTFGSIAGERHRSVLGTLGTLPLRFLSFLVLALWILYFACWISSAEWWFYDHVLGFLLPTAYLFFSAYVTFRSPPKAILFVAGLGANVPVVYAGLFAHSIYFRFSHSDEAAFYVFMICSSLVTAWVVFLIARLSLRTCNVRNPLSILTNPQITRGKHLDHQCLGSRFMEWQERHAH